MTHNDMVQALIDSDPNVVGADPIGISDSEDEGAILYEFIDEHGSIVFIKAVEL